MSRRKMKKSEYSYWIKERHNPQLGNPYYHCYGQLSKTAAAKKEKSLYGFNIMLEFKTKEEYDKKIESLKKKGLTVYYE